MFMKLLKTRLKTNFPILASNGCPDIVPPDNGAMACDMWVGGRFCHPLCSQGYSALVSLPNFMVCTTNGIWTNHKNLSDCHRKYGFTKVINV